MRYNYLILIILASLLVGCVKNTPSTECPSDKDNLFLDFAYYGDGDEDIFANKISEVDLFIFDDLGQIVTYGVTTENRYALELPEGRYRLVCWGNALERTELHNPLPTRSDLDRSYVVTAVEEGEGMDPLYYATNSKEEPLYIIVDEKEKLERKVNFSSAHIVLKAYFKGFAKGEDPKLLVKNVPSEYDFAMGLGGDKITYSGTVGTTKKEGEELQFIEYNLPRLKNDNEVVLIVKDSERGEELCVVEFSEFLETNNIDITNRQEVVVEMLFEFKSIGVEVTVPEWEDVPVKPTPEV